jgi:hypothetical protein
MAFSAHAVSVTPNRELTTANSHKTQEVQVHWEEDDFEYQDNRQYRGFSSLVNRTICYRPRGFLYMERGGAKVFRQLQDRFKSETYLSISYLASQAESKLRRKKRTFKRRHAFATDAAAVDARL